MNCHELAKLTQLDYQHDSDQEISNLRDPDFIEENALYFIKDKKFLEKLKQNLNNESIHLIVPEDFFEKSKSELSEITISIFLTSDFEISMSRVSKVFFDLKFKNVNPHVDGRQMSRAEIDPRTTISQNVFIGEDVKIAQNVTIHPGVVLMNGVSVDEGSEIFPNTTLYPNVRIGKNVRIHSGATIGADGFGYNFKDGVHHKVWHFGSVVIEDDVEIGANSCVDGGTFSPTFIGRGSKLDNHVQIGHNCKLGMGVIICGHVAIGGSSNIGNFTVFGGKSGMGNTMTLGQGCQVAGGALVNTDWPDGSVLGGHPARPLKEWMRGLAFVRKESLRK